MKDKKESGLDVFQNVFNQRDIFEPIIKWGEYKMTEEFNKSSTIEDGYYSDCEKAKLELVQPLAIRKLYKKGSFAYVYILNGVELIYAGQCSSTSRISTPSSVGGFVKGTRVSKISSDTHGKTNIKLFYEVNELIHRGDKLEVYIVKAKDHVKKGRWTVKICEKQMEKEILTSYKELYGRTPKLNNRNKDYK